MVYKLMGNLTDDIFGEVIEILKKYHKFIYKNGNIYLAVGKYLNRKDAEKELDKIDKMRDNGVFMIEINENNLKNECPEVIQWCRDELVRLDRERYEVENKDGIKKMFEVLDLFEANLNKVSLSSLNFMNKKEGKEDINA